jgi:hypothetical protein
MPLCHHCQILGENPILEASKASGNGALGITSLKALLKNAPQLVVCLHVLAVVAALHFFVLHVSSSLCYVQSVVV